MNKLLLAIISLSVILTACKTSKLEDGTRLRKRNPKYILTKIEENRIDFQWVKAKAKAKVVSPEENVSFTIKLRMRKDSLIWLQIKKVSVEGLRVQMDPDRIEVLNRQDNQYIVEPFTAIRKNLAIPFDFDAVQNLLLGNPIMYDNIEFKSKIDSGHYYMEGQIPHPMNENEFIGDIHFWLNAAFQIVRLEAKVDDNEVFATFSDYQEVDGRTIAMVKKIRMKSPESGEVRMKIDFNKVEFDVPTTMRFSIPDHYEKIINGNKQK
jgi:hypothetical protein